MFFAVRMMVLAKAFPTEMLYVLAVGLLLIVVSLVMEKAYFGLVTLALDVISNFVDIISYVRLYAVGAASFAIANAFNTMAIEALGSSGIIVGGLIAALALFGGHALNILLCAMGILVHGIRLNTLEFSSHAGVQWGGLHYNPFKRTNEKF
jgi:V/A-type H+-transporting ATPase subunit I